MYLRGAGAMYQPPCVCSTSGVRCTAPAPVSSASHSPPGMLHRAAEAAPMRQPSLAPLVIDTGEYRCCPMLVPKGSVVLPALLHADPMWPVHLVIELISPPVIFKDSWAVLGSGGTWA